MKKAHAIVTATLVLAILVYGAVLRNHIVAKSDAASFADRWPQPGEEFKTYGLKYPTEGTLQQNH